MLSQVQEGEEKVIAYGSIYLQNSLRKHWRWYLPAISNKLGQGWTGPYLVLRKISDVTYEIQINSENKPITVHVDHLKPFQGRQPPINWLKEPDSFPEEEIISKPLDEQILDESLVQPLPKSPVKTRTGRTIKPRDVFLHNIY